MNLKLKFTKDATQFIDFLSAFKRIGDSLLFEIDIENQKFLAKSNGGSMSIESSRYSDISFESIGVELLSELTGDTPSRVYVGVLNRLGKLTAILSEANRRAFSEEDAYFTFEIEYTTKNITDIAGNQSTIYGASSICIKTSKLKGNKGLSTTMGCCDLNKRLMTLITDQQFDEVLYYLDPDTLYRVPVCEDSLESIFKMMDIYKSSKKDDEVVVNITNNKISISNETINAQRVEESFNEIVYEGEINDWYTNQSIAVSKDMFKKNVDRKTPIVLSIGTSAKGEIDRLCFENMNDDAIRFKVVLIRIKHAED